MTGAAALLTSLGLIWMTGMVRLWLCTNNALVPTPKMTGWWFQPLRKILVNGKGYPIYYGK